MAENWIAAATAILFRVALQLINWLLAHWLIAIIARRVQGGEQDDDGRMDDGPEAGRVIHMPDKPMTPEAGRLWAWIADKGTATRKQVFQSRTLNGQDDYDKAIAELIRVAAISCNASGPMTGWTYSANNIEEGRATA